MIDEQVRKLVCYGLERGLFTERDEIYVTNIFLKFCSLTNITAIPRLRV